MSWFTEMAGKAEDLLNKVDKSAATALQNKSKQSSCEGSSTYNNYTEIASESSYSPSRAFSPLQKTTPTTLLDRKPLHSQGSTAQKKKPESDHEKLLQFLNGNEVLPSSIQKGKSKVVSPVKKMTENIDSQPPELQIVENLKNDSEATIDESQPVPDVCDVALVQAVGEQNVEVEILQNQASNSSTVAFNRSAEVAKETISETISSSRELMQAEKRTKHAEAEMVRMQRKLDHWNSQISGNDKVLRELKEREKDMIAAMDAKDSQLAILKVRLQEADQEIQAKRNIVKDLKVENDRIIKEHAQSAAFQNKTVEVLQEQLQQKEAELNKTRDTFLQNQNEHMQKLGKMEEEHRHLVESYSSLQKKWTELNEKNKEVTIQLKQSTGNLEALQQEYNDYKQKAQRILQSKEKLISSLKGGHLEADSIERNEAASALLNAEVEGIKQERDLIRDELRRANELIETYRAEIQELEKMSQNDAIVSQERYKVLKDQFDVEKTQKEELQLLSTQLKEELQFLREDLTRTKTSFQSRVQDREIEIEKLRRQLTAKSLSTVSQDELESRLHALTENLIQKQTLVEALSTEKNSLVLQLERLEQQLREAQKYGLQQHTYVGINNNEAERKSKTVFLENPFDSALTRRVKKVYGSIDSFSIRLGVFFRRYPITRVFVIIYMLLLHFWVMIVLLTYEPEVHNSGYEVPKNQ